MFKKSILICLSLALISTVTFSQTKNEKKISNKELVKTAVTAVFVNRDLTAIDKYWGTEYIQHNPYTANGRETIKQAVAKLKPDFKYEPGLIIEDGEFVMVHGRYLGLGAKPMLAIDIFRVKNGKLVEHWDVMQDEVPADKTASGNPMFPIK